MHNILAVICSFPKDYKKISQLFFGRNVGLYKYSFRSEILNGHV